MHLLLTLFGDGMQGNRIKRCLESDNCTLHFTETHRETGGSITLIEVCLGGVVSYSLIMSDIILL